MVDVILSAPVTWQHTSPAVGPSTPPSSLSAAFPQQQEDKSSTIWSLVGSESAFSPLLVISSAIEMTIPHISMECEMKGHKPWDRHSCLCPLRYSPLITAGVANRLTSETFRFRLNLTMTCLPDSKSLEA